MTTRKVMIAVALVLGLGIAAYLVFMPPHHAATLKPPKVAVGDSDPDAFTFRGKVVDSAGKPMAGAKLLLVAGGEQPVEIGVSAADGTFALLLPKENKGRSPFVVAQTGSAGIGFALASKMPANMAVEMRLVKDQVIQGRVINTEAQPVADVKVSVTDLVVYQNNSLDAFLAQWLRNPAKLPNPAGHLVLTNDVLLSATTDADGRFTIAGAGFDRFVELSIRGQGIADSKIWVANRPGFDPIPYNKAAADSRDAMPFGFGLKWLVYGPDLTVVAEGARLIRGVVKDIDTGLPRPAAKVALSRDGNELLLLPLKAITDDKGHYEIRGARKGKAYVVEVESDPTGGYMAAQVHAPDTPGFDPIDADIEVKKGVIVTGRVIDAVTKKAMAGTIMIEPLAVNTFAKKYPEFGSSTWSSIRPTDEDGTFRVVTIPGPVLLMGGPDSKRLPAGEIVKFKFKPAQPDPKFPDSFGHQHEVSGYFPAKGGFSPLHGNFCKVLDIKAGSDVVTQDIALEPATSLMVVMLDARLSVEGKLLPLNGAWVTGISPQNWHLPISVRGDTCAAFDLEPGKPRLMVFFSGNKKYVGTLALKGDEKVATHVKLGAPGIVQGRLLGEDGKPLAEVVVNLTYAERTAAKMHDQLFNDMPIQTNADGKFRFAQMIPGQQFSLAFRRGSSSLEPLSALAPGVVEAGATLNLGELKLKLKAEK